MTIRVRGFTFIALVVCAAALGLSVSGANAKQQSNQQNTPAPQNPGERAFQANCSRCHYAPDQLPRSISGTIVRHMRVRANLSAEDEKGILRYLAP